MNIRFVWDPRKATRNLEKHNVRFEEAITVFADRLAAIFDDEVHAKDEYRELIIGHSSQNRLLIVAFAERTDGIRIISARRATRKEREAYAKAKR